MASFEDLKTKYAPAFKTIEQQGVRVQNLHMQGDKLFLKGTAPSEAAKGYVWTALKAVDPTASDLVADITVDPSLPQPRQAEQTYTVKAGDTLSKISKEIYGDAKRYVKIYEANRDQLSDPDKIKPGQVLKIPAA
jgi:nucleoid-associated protein YgaU